ncbi:hypothetical protein GGQ20_003266 [Salinibacter ruber]|uniref:T9SS type A sorting domain-containing protein n=1 Tax=Salinibacter ruber TaxID=146919 RepID=UPI0021679F1B|nr:T9SS type A sorting domain-containing protein [Salinibacter ruber]MCS3701923.1 hypothetical protein [Salinibacter ruber]
MDVPKLLRTTLFSVLSLLLIGGLTVAQAQETVEVTPGDFDNLEQALVELDTQVGNNSNTSAGVLAIEANDYRDVASSQGDDAILELDEQEDANGNPRSIQNIESLTIEARPGAQNAVVIGRIEYDPDGANTDLDVTIQSEGGAFVRLTETGANGNDIGQPALSLGGGTFATGSFTVDAAGDVQLDGGTTVQRFAGVELAGDIQYDGRPSLSYTTSNGSPISESGALPDNGNLVTLRVSGNGTVDFSEAIVAEGIVRSNNPNTPGFGISGSATANFDSDLTVSTGVFNAGTDQTIDVGGTLTLGDANAATVTVDGELEAGSVEATYSGDGGFDGSGTLTVESTFSANLPDDSDPTANVNVAPGSAASFDVGTVQDENRFDDDGNLIASTNVLINANSLTADGTLDAAGTLESVASSGTAPDAAGTLTLLDAEITGNVDVSGSGKVNIGTGGTAADVSVAAASTFNNAGSGIEISEGSELLIDVDGGITVQNGGSGIFGDGTLAFDDQNTDGATSYTVENTTDANILPNLEVAAGNGVDVEAGGDTNQNGFAIVTGSVTANEALTFNDPDANGGGVSVGALTANATVDFYTNNGSGDVSVGSVTANEPVTFGTNVNAITGGDITAAANLNFNNGGSIDLGALTVTSGETAIASSAGIMSLLDFQIENTGTFDIADATVEVERNFTRMDGADVTVDTDGDTDLEFTGAEDATLNLGDTRFLFEQGDITVSKDQAADASVVVDGLLRIANNARLRLQEPANSLAQTTLTFNQNLNVDQSTIRLETGAGDFQVDTGENTVVFRGSGNAIKSDGAGNLMISNIQNRASNDLNIGGSSNSLTVTVTDVINLSTDGITVLDGAVLDPGPGAEVIRNVGETGTEIATGGSGTFNDAENIYNLTYTGDGSATTDDELNSFVGNLAVESDATANLDDSYEIQDTLSVAGRIGENGGTRTLTLASDSAEHSVTGRIEGANNAITLQVDGTGAVVTGTDNPQLAGVSNVARIENFVANDQGVVVENLHEIAGDLDVSADIVTQDTTITPSLTLGLADDQTAGSALTASNALTLASDVTTEGNVNVNVDASTGDAEDGSITFGEYDLTLTGNFTGQAGASYTADGGALVFGNDNSFQNFGTASEAVPNVTVFDDGGGSGVDVSDLNADQDTSAVSNSLTVQAPIDLNGQVLNFQGQTVLSANINDNTPNAAGVFRAVGSDVVVSGGTRSIQNFTVDSESDTVSVLSATPQTNPRTLSVPGTFALNSGTVAHGQNTLSVGSNFVVGSDLGSESEGILGGPGYFAFNGTTTALAANVSIDRLQVLGNSSLASGSDGEITIADVLWLNAGLSTSGADNGSLAVADGTTIRRTEGSSQTSLDETPSFAGEVNLTYNTTSNTSSTSLTSGREVPSADGPGTISSVEADPGTRLTFSPVTDNANNVVAASGNVIVEDEFILESGNLRYGFGSNRQLELAEDARFVRVDGQIPAQVTVGGDQFDIPSITASDYTLVYRPENGDIESSSREFRGDANIDLSVTQRLNPRTGDPIGNGNVRLHADRTVDSLFVDRTNGSFQLGVFNQNNNLVPSTLTVDGETVVDGGTVNSGTLQAQGDFVGSGGTVNSSLLADADVTTEAPTPTSFGDLRFVGTDVQSFSPATSAAGQPTSANLTLNQESDTTDTPRVLADNTVSVPNTLDLQNGLLVLENQEDEVSLGGTFTRNVADGDASHVVGAVRQGGFQSNATNRVAYPLGTIDGNYREFVLDYLNDFQNFPQGFNIRIGHVNQTPDGSLGLPVTDDTGVTVDKGDRFWRVQPNQSLGVSASVDVEIVSEGLLEGEDAPNENDFRILRRFDGNAQENDYRVQGFGSQYDNILRGDGSLRIRAPNSTGSLASEGAIFTVGVPTGVQDNFSIAGSVTYPTVSDGSLVDGRSLSGVPVEASSADTTVTDTTDANGNYTIGGLPAGDYDVTPTVSDSVENVSTADALRAVRGFAGIDAFAGSFQEQVADVNGSGGVNATDALQIARFDLGLTDGFSVGSFVTESETVVLGDSSASGVELFAAEAGDVRLDGGETGGSSQTLAASTLSPEQGLSAARTQSASSGASEAAVEAGETFEVPVRMGRGAEVGAYQMTVNYDSDIASFDGVKAAQEGVLTNASEDGTVQVSWFDQSGESALDLRDGSDLVTLQFTASEDAAETDFSPEVKSGEITGPDAAPISAGVELQAVSIGAPAPDEFALNGSYPNPVQGQATIEMDIPSKASVTIEVYNVLGQRVQTMEQSMSAGSGQTIQLDGSNLASGQYFYRVEADLEDGSAQKSGRITVVK